MIKTLLQEWYTSKFATAKDIINICLGLFHKQDIAKWISTLIRTGIRCNEAKQILFKLSRSICMQVRKKIWNDRCSRLQDSGLKPSIQKCKKRSISKIRKKKVEKYNQEEENRDTDNSSLQEVREKDSSPIQVQNKSIWEWIKEGKKWLGL